MIKFITSESVTPNEVLRDVGMDRCLHDDLLDVAQGRFLQPPGSVLYNGYHGVTII